MRAKRLILGAAALCLLMSGSRAALAKDWTTDLRLDIGYQGFPDESGNVYRYEQYATPPSGIFLDQLAPDAENSQNALHIRGKALTYAWIGRASTSHPIGVLTSVEASYYHRNTSGCNIHKE